MVYRAVTVAAVLAVGCADGDGSREQLSNLGLYSDIVAKTVADGVLEYSPAHELWSDHASKRRWLVLPRGKTIDSSDIDRWDFPVGTKLFKEFVRDGVLVETRMIERIGSGPRDYWLGAFVWNEDESDAYFAELGEENARGTDHDVPDATMCATCHVGEAGFVLGFSAVQLGSALAVPPPLMPGEWLSDVPSPWPTIPGDAVESAALGALHANCGHCHNESGSAWPDTDLVLRVSATDSTVEGSALYRSTVDVEHDRWGDETYRRIVSGSPWNSGILVRMNDREGRDAMPPVATELSDSEGSAAVSAWIQGL